MTAADHRVILLHAQAPAKPATGRPCNGCGACCAWQPCPLGVLVSRKRQGRCSALHWQADAGHYRCALVANPRLLWPALPVVAAATLQRLARRWIAAGIGCDADIEIQPPPSPVPSPLPLPLP